MPVPPSFSRRAFLAGGLATALGLIAARRGESCGTGRAGHAGHAGRVALDPHPTPRAGVDASRVPKTDQLKEASRRAVSAFDEVRQIPQVVDGIRCHCGCAGQRGFYSLLSCYEGAEAMAQHCEICQGQGRMAYRLHRAGKSLDEIRAAIDARYD